MDKWDLILGRLKNKAEKVISKPKKMVFFHKHCPLVMFRKIALAIAFSPRMEALIAESKRLKDLFQAELLLIHVGEKTVALEEKLNELWTSKYIASHFQKIQSLENDLKRLALTMS